MILAFPSGSVLSAEPPFDFCCQLCPRPVRVCMWVLNSHFLYFQRPLNNHRNYILFRLICCFSNWPNLTLAHVCQRLHLVHYDASWSSDRRALVVSRSLPVPEQLGEHSHLLLVPTTENCAPLLFFLWMPGSQI